MTASTLIDLPKELLLIILDYIQPEDGGVSSRDSQALSRTCRTFHYLIAPELYAGYNSYYGEPYLFLRTMISAPQLAKFVKHLELNYGSWAHHNHSRHRATAQDKKIIKDGLKRSGLPDWKSWASTCNTAYIEVDILYAAILMYTPNLTSLNLSGRRSNDSRGFRNIELINILRNAVRRPAFKCIPTFKTLRSIRVTYKLGSDIEYLAIIFQIPSLRKLQLQFLSIQEDEEGKDFAANLRRKVQQQSSNIEDLELIRSFVSMDVMEVFVKSASNLRSLRYDLAVRRATRCEDVFLQEDKIFARLLALLACHKGSLQQFYFTSDAINEPAITEAIFSDGFRQFEKLEKVCCPLHIFYHRDQHFPPALANVFPPSLTTFHATIQKDGFREPCLGALEDLAVSYRADLPLLREVRIFLDAWTKWAQSDFMRLVEPFSLANISLIVEGGREVPHFAAMNVKGRYVLDDSESSCESDEVSLYSNRGDV